MLGLLAVLTLLPALLGVLVLRGSDVARLSLLLIVCVSVATQFVAWLTDSSDWVLGLSLMVVALDVLALLALSGRAARRFSEGRRLD
ncbi:hypothetical protein [Litorihabitans aurantiacus]|uniref:Uncharacterized protein n=1 Tax=Litorihabitans aurantiacus TaxID=1930061 RepID=A0AA38CVK0_9MICO|nr:hypothetical protein [Litorihabitans aurantiacus]GMA32517.1 hypothetical protein GCM10025875_25090 [Litorihabitans aurantiacus]